MSDLEQLERERGNEEYNISSLQLIPVNIVAYRSQYGSANPAAVIAPAIVATFFSTVVAVIYCKIMEKRQRV